MSVRYRQCLINFSDGTANVIEPLWQDGDCDGFEVGYDCDDTDPSDVLFAGDCDQDGIDVADDCDDFDPASVTRFVDGDCDGLLTADDCDDSRSVFSCHRR